jgi:hypothetical protein
MIRRSWMLFSRKNLSRKGVFDVKAGQTKTLCTGTKTCKSFSETFPTFEYRQLVNGIS